MPELLPPLASGDVLSRRYRLEAHLGAGATASVWRARDLDLGRVVAVKALLGADVAPELAGRFRREGEILGRLDHPNVVPVHGTGIHEGRPYLVMELVEGRSLDDRLRDGPMPVQDALELAADVAAGLGAAHQAGVIHRDVKPANIVCGTDGVTRLVDFGIARADDLTVMTQADVVLGTAGYLSPEQARGDALGPTSDVYALGCVLYEALTGRPPFQGDTSLAVAYQQVHDDPDPPSLLRPEVAGPVEAVVLRCLAKSADERYADGAELEADLRRAARGEAPAAAPAVAFDPAATTVSAPVGPDATQVLPVASVSSVAGGIDPSPLAPPSPRSRRWVPIAVVAAALLALVLVAGALDDDGPGTPVDAGEEPVATTTTTTTTAPPTTTLPPPPPVQDEEGDGAEERGEGRTKGKANGKGDD